MTWAKGDDRQSDHPKILALSDAAHRLWWNANIWSNRHLTDGRLPAKNARALMALQDPGTRFEDLVAETTTVQPGERNPLWHERDFGWEIHDFLEHNIPKATVLAERKRRRKAGARGGRATARKRAGGKPLAAGATAGATGNVPPRPDPTDSLEIPGPYQRVSSKVAPALT